MKSLTLICSSCVQSWIDVAMFGYLTDEGLSASRERIREQVTETIKERVTAHGFTEVSSSTVELNTEMRINTAKESIVKACLVFGHAVLVGTVIDLLKLTCEMSLNAWKPHLHETKIKVGDVEKYGYEKCLTRLAENEIHNLRGTSAKVQRLLEIVKPEREWNVRNLTNICGRIGDLTRKRDDIAHGRKPAKPADTDDVDFLRSANYYLCEITAKRYGENIVFTGKKG